MTYKINITDKTISNNKYRKTLFSNKHLELVIMSLKPTDKIGEEIHKNTTQIINVINGSGVAIINKKKYLLKKNNLVIIPNNVSHNIIAGKNGLKLYSLYIPPEHKL